MTKTIRIAERCGRYLASRRVAGQLRAYIVMLIEAENVPHVTVDFAGVESISNSFTDGFIGFMVVEQGVAWVKSHVELVGLESDDREAVDAVVKLRAAC